jgi:organic radical activating enzyme
LVITGGEPTLFLDNLILLELIEFALCHNKRVTIETNATVEIDFQKYKMLKECTFAMSVKLANSGEIYAKRIKPQAIKAITNNTNSFFKFVVKDEQDANEIKEIIMLAPQTQIYCMPLGATNIELNSRAKIVFEMCLKYNWCYSDRIHIRIFDDLRGV